MGGPLYFNNSVRVSADVDPSPLIEYIFPANTIRANGGDRVKISAVGAFSAEGDPTGTTLFLGVNGTTIFSHVGLSGAKNIWKFDGTIANKYAGADNVLDYVFYTGKNYDSPGAQAGSIVYLDVDVAAGTRDADNFIAFSGINSVFVSSISIMLYPGNPGPYYL